MYQSTGDSGSGEYGVDLTPHATGDPIRGGAQKLAAVTTGHTWVIIIGALALLWLLGGGLFKSIRM